LGRSPIWQHRSAPAAIGNSAVHNCATARDDHGHHPQAARQGTRSRPPCRERQAGARCRASSATYKRYAEAASAIDKVWRDQVVRASKTKKRRSNGLPMLKCPTNHRARASLQWVPRRRHCNDSLLITRAACFTCAMNWPDGSAASIATAATAPIVAFIWNAGTAAPKYPIASSSMAFR